MAKKNTKTHPSKEKIIRKFLEELEGKTLDVRYDEGYTTLLVFVSDSTNIIGQWEVTSLASYFGDDHFIMSKEEASRRYSGDDGDNPVIGAGELVIKFTLPENE